MADDFERWAGTCGYAWLETTISRDVLLMTPGGKAALTPSLFELGVPVLGGRCCPTTRGWASFQDGGNTTTLGGYLELLASAGNGGPGCRSTRAARYGSALP